MFSSVWLLQTFLLTLNLSAKMHHRNVFDKGAQQSLSKWPNFLGTGQDLPGTWAEFWEIIFFEKKYSLPFFMKKKRILAPFFNFSKTSLTYIMKTALLVYCMCHTPINTPKSIDPDIRKKNSDKRLSEISRAYNSGFDVDGGRYVPEIDFSYLSIFNRGQNSSATQSSSFRTPVTVM